MGNYYLTFNSVERALARGAPLGSVKFDAHLLALLTKSGYKLSAVRLVSRIRPQPKAVFFEKEYFVAGLTFSLNHLKDFIMSNYATAVGVSLNNPRVVALPHVEPYVLLKYRMQGVDEQFKDLWVCRFMERMLKQRKALDLLASEYFRAKTAVVCYTEEQVNILSRVVPKARKVLLPPPVTVDSVPVVREKMYDVLLPVTYWKTCDEGIAKVVRALKNRGLRVAIKDHLETKTFKILAEKFGVAYLGYTKNYADYLGELASARVVLDVSLCEAFGFRFAEAILVGTPVVSVFRGWFKTVPQIEELGTVTSIDYGELLSKQLEEVKRYTPENFAENFKANFPFSMLDGGKGIDGWL